MDRTEKRATRKYYISLILAVNAQDELKWGFIKDTFEWLCMDRHATEFILKNLKFGGFLGMIIFCYGIPKSASTFTFQLTQKVLELSGYSNDIMPPEIIRPNLTENYLDILNQEIITMVDEFAQDTIIVVKTHAPISDAVKDLLDTDRAYALANYRDPRDIALSYVDHGQRSRSKGQPFFAPFHDPKQALKPLKQHYDDFKGWYMSHNVKSILYDDICFNSLSTLSEIIRFLGLNIDADTVLESFIDKENTIGQFNKGKKQRYIDDMNDSDKLIFEKELKEFIENLYVYNKK